MATTLMSLAGAILGGAAAVEECRCLPGDPCWAKVPWGVLNQSVGGRLVAFVDELEPCIADAGSEQCTAALDLASGFERTTDDHFLADTPQGFQHSGLFGAWNASRDHFAYAVKARTEQDFQATTRFALLHNLRLVVKNTGHDWYGRSTAAGSLMLWTHSRKNMTWHEAYVPEECSADQALEHYHSPAGEGGVGLPAVTVESGVQFYELYPAAQDRGRLVIGGTCDSVGVAGCWLSGCYGVFSKKFGAGAMNMLSARVVLANGTMVTASKCSHPELFWSLRGGGGGVAGVVTEFTAKTHPAPQIVTGMQFAANVTTLEEYGPLVEQVLASFVAAIQDTDAAPNGGVGFRKASYNPAVHPNPNSNGAKHVYGISISIQGYGDTLAQQNEFLAPLAAYVHSQRQHRAGNTTIEGAVSVVPPWVAEMWDPKKPAAPWYSYSAGDKGSATVNMMSKFWPFSRLRAEEGRKTLAGSMIKVVDALPGGGGFGLMIPKAQAGISKELEAEFNQTALNPVILDTSGTMLLMDQLPWFEQLGRTPRHLKQIWPTLNQPNNLEKFAQYARGGAAAVVKACDAGARGSEAAAAECFGMWQDQMIPAFTAKMDKVRDVLDEVLPNVDADGRRLSGSYWSETDYWLRDFQASYWGPEKYPKLLKVKADYDPTGLFVCHHCVGSEFWTAESSLNCRNKTHSNPFV